MKLYPMVADRLPQYEQLVAGIEQQKTPVLAVGLSDIHKAHLLYALSEQLLSPLLIICDEETAARRMCDDVNAMHGKETPAALLYPAREYNFRGTAQRIARIRTAAHRRALETAAAGMQALLCQRRSGRQPHHRPPNCKSAPFRLKKTRATPSKS